MTHPVKHRRGPKPRPESELRHNRVGIYFTDDEFEHLVELAGAAGKDGAALRKHLGRFIRAVIFGHTPRTVPEINRQAWTELSRASANLNQLARAGNSGEAVEAEAIREALADFRLSLIGAGGEK